MITHSISLLGKRDSNEDQHDIFIKNNNDEYRKINYFGVYDGHGGKDVSKFLKDNLKTYFISKYNNFDIHDCNKCKKYIEKVFNHLQIKLEKRFKDISYNIGSTALIAMLYEDKQGMSCYVANAGDCRSILCDSKNMIKQLSKDHKPHMVDEKKRIEKLGGKIYYDGYDWRISDLSVSRAFGDMDASPYVTHKPEIFKYKIPKNSKFIILGCDGLWDVLSNQEVSNFVLNKLENTEKLNFMSRNSPNNIAYSLAKYAIEKGSTDNVSIVIVFL